MDAGLHSDRRAETRTDPRACGADSVAPPAGISTLTGLGSKCSLLGWTWGAVRSQDAVVCGVEAWGVANRAINSRGAPSWFGQQGDRSWANVAGFYRPRHRMHWGLQVRRRRLEWLQAPHCQRRGEPGIRVRLQQNHRRYRGRRASTMRFADPTMSLLARHSFEKHSIGIGIEAAPGRRSDKRDAQG
jgi:hypothetical protein